jgi:sugar lactone lactonase YvrE
MTVRQESLRVVGATRAELGESPVWDAGTEQLLWLDILGETLLRTDPPSGVSEATAVGQRPGSLALTDGEALLIASGQDILLRGSAGEVRTLATLPTSGSARCNDGKPDAAGRFWVGTASRAAEPEGHLYCCAPGEPPRAVLDGIHMSNGLGWSPDNRCFYYVDTATRRLDAFDFGLATGHLANRRTLLQLPPGQLPDGLTVDSAGRVWLAVWGGACVLVIAPDGRIEARVELPTACVSSCTFGGLDLRTLFITTAQEGMSAEELAADPLAGALFAVETDVAGLPPNRVTLRG